MTVKYANQGATRNQPLSPELAKALSFAADMGIEIEVFSGGQPAKGTSTKRVGSTRHDHGHSGDIFLRKDGRRLDWNNADDLPIFNAFVTQAMANGVSGFGAGDGYMQPGSMHVGFGSKGVWGAGGKGKNAAPWLKAVFAGTPLAGQPNLTRNVAVGDGQQEHTFGPSATAPAETRRTTMDYLTLGQNFDEIGTTPSTTYRTSLDDKAAAAALEAQRPSFWDATKMAIDEQWIGTNVADQLGRPDVAPDPSWRLTEELLKERAAHLAPAYQDELGNSTSAAHFDILVKEMTREQEVDQKLGQLGWGGVGLQLGAAILDPVAIAASAVTEGAAAPFFYGAKIGRLSRGLRAGASAAAVNAGVDGYLASQDPTAGWDDVAYSALAGFAIGAPLGMLRKTPEDAAIAREAVKLMKAEEPKYAGGTPDGSLGAARVAPEEVTLSAAEQVAADSASAPTTAFSSIRLDRSAVMKSSESGIMRRMGGLVEDGVGNADGSVNRYSVSESVAREERVRNARFYRVYNDAYKSWLKDQGKRMPWQHGVNERSAFNQAVTLAVRREIDGANNKHVNAVASQMKKEFADLLQFGKNMGIKGFEEVATNYNYMVRRHRVERIDDLVSEFGEGRVNRMVANSIQKANRKWRNANPKRAAEVEEIDYEDALKISGSYLKSIRSRRYGEFNLNRALSGQDVETLKMMLDDAGMSGEDVARISDKVRFSLDEGDKGKIASARWRLDLDETHREKMISKNGVEREVGIEDMLENDAEQLFGQYVRSVSAAGHMEDFLKQFRVPDATGNLPVYAPSFETVKGYIAAEAGEKGMDANTLRRQMRTLENTFKLISGVPIEEPSRSRTAQRFIRDWNFSRIGGQLGVAQLAEIGNIIGNGGVRVLMQNIPALKRIFASAKTGKFSDDLLNEIETIWGFGTDLTRMNMSPMFDSMGAVEHSTKWQKFDHALQRTKRATVVGSGMGHVNMVLQRLNARVLVQRFMDDATGKRGINAKRLRVMGIDDSLHSRIQEQLRKHVDQETGMLGRKVNRINIQKWDDIDAKNAFINGVDRWAKKSIQENDIGNMPDFMSYELGKTVFQFRSFMLAAYVKQTLAGAHMRDWETLSAFLTSMFFGGLFYAGQTYVNSFGRDDRKEYLEERLSPTSIGRASFQRAAFSSVIPMTADMATAAVGVDPMFDFRSSGLSSGGVGPMELLLSNPTMDLGEGVFRATGGISQAMFNPNYDFSERDLKALTKVFVMQNMFGIRNGIAALGGQLPDYSD